MPEGSRVTDYISLGVISRTFPLKRVRAVLAATGKASQRERDLPAHVVPNWPPSINERWGSETARAECKTHLRGARIVLRSKTPDLLRQEF